MVSRHQRGDHTTDYATDAARMLDTKPKELLLCIRPMDIDKAQIWLGECNRLDVDTEIKDHFYNEIQRLKEQ